MGERAQIVAWLRGLEGKQFTVWERVKAAWFALSKGEAILYYYRLVVADFIERGEHLPRDGGQD